MMLATKSGQAVSVDESRKIGSGKRGTVYSLQQRCAVKGRDPIAVAAKVFAPRYRTAGRKGKVEKLAELGKSCPARGAWPICSLYDDGQWVGYLMPWIDGRLYDQAIYDAGIGALDRLEMCAQTCETIKLLHRHGIVMGDLSTRNFLYQSVPFDGGHWLEVCAIDLDSAQVRRDDRAVYAVTESKERSPEMPDVLGKSLLTSRSDDYLAAVLVFKTLFMIDPRDEFSPDSLPVDIRAKNARNRVFAYKGRSDAYPIDAFGDDLAQLFNRSFEEGPYEDIPTCGDYEKALHAAKLALVQGQGVAWAPERLMV